MGDEEDGGVEELSLCMVSGSLNQSYPLALSALLQG